jgi:neutral ceramidase
MMGRSICGLLLALGAAGCGAARSVALPAPPPHRPVSGDLLRAGFGRADITPPPGFGLGGNGPEGRQARGWRTRLYVRALVLQDARGERIALVVADLVHISALLQRRVAELLPPGLGISADNLLLSATHTHSGPGHFYEATEFNLNGSSVVGFDAKLTDFLAGQIAHAVRQAAENPRPARIAWGQRPIWGLTRNRSYEAFRRNTPRWDLETPPPGLDPVYAAVNPVWTMLRVDLATDEAATTFRPAGGYSIFAIHGTGNPSVTELYDADIHGIVERGLERYIDQKYGAGRDHDPLAPPDAIHLLANGAEGDVSPDWPDDSRCPPALLEPVPRPEGPGTPMVWDWRMPTPAAQAACISSGRRFIRDIGDSLTRHAIALFESLGSSLSGNLDLAIGFETLALRRDSAELGICGHPAVGTSTAAGAEDARTRFAGWKFLGILGIGLEEGGKAVSRDPRTCQGFKRTDLVKLTKKRGLPEFAQISVARVGDRYLATLPVEPTTMAAATIQRTVGAALGLDWPTARRRVTIVGLTNGFLQYLTTRAEYSAQSYEGGSTIYGPGEAEMFARELGRLADSLNRTGAGGSLVNRVDSIFGRPGDDKKLWPSRGPGVASPAPAPRWIHCAPDTVIGRWNGPSLDRLRLAGTPQIALERETQGGWEIVTWDDDPNVEVWVHGIGASDPGYELRWSAPTAGTHLRFRVLTAAGNEVSDVCTP